MGTVKITSTEVEAQPTVQEIERAGKRVANRKREIVCGCVSMHDGGILYASLNLCVG